MSFVTAALITGGAAIAGSAISAYGANKAGEQQAQANQAALAQQQRMYDQTRSDLAPYRDVGSSAAGELNTDIASGGQKYTGGITPSDVSQWLNPGMDFAMKWGQQGVTNLANTSGGAFSGNTLKAISDYTTGSALNQYWTPAVQTAMANKQNAFSNLYNVAGMGAGASGAGATGAPSFASTMGNTASNIGQAQASGTVGTFGNIGAGISNAANAYTGYTTLPAMMSYYKSLGKNAGGAE